MTPFLTWNEYLAKAEQRLVEAGVEDARTNVEYILAQTMGLHRLRDIRTVLHERAWREEKRKFNTMLLRRIAREPLQYILGKWEFYGLPIQLNSDVLIPRPETEILVEQVLKETILFRKKVSILDIGTGSGCIALALAFHLPRATVVGVDISGPAIILARDNSKRLRLGNVRFRQRDMFFYRWNFPSQERFNLIVSNPPYVSQQDFELLEPELRLYEPRVALTDNADGLTFYKRIAEVAPSLLLKDGRVLVELGFGMADQVGEIFREHGLEVIQVTKDLAGIARVLTAKLSK